MLDPRIYRTGLVAIALAVIVFAFSLQNPQGAEHTDLSPTAFDGGTAYASMRSLFKEDPVRAPGSPQDNAVAGDVQSALSSSTLKHAFSVSTSSFSADTAAGTQTLETVTGLDPGLSSGAVAVIAPRDGSGEASLSGTAVLMELAQALSTETLNRSVVLISTSGTAGSAGTSELAGQLSADHVEAAIVLGDLAGRNASQPVIVPWSDSRVVAPTALRDTLAAALRQQAGLSGGSPGVAAQLARLAFPLTLSPQGPLDTQGIPAVTLSLSGERGPTADEALYAGSPRIAGTGGAVLQAVDALDSGAPIAAPTSYLAFDGKLVPFWAIRLVVLALLLPLLLVSIDGVARARRRGHSVSASIGWVLAAAVPFLLAVVVLRGAKLTSVISTAPPGPVGPGVVPAHTAGAIVLLLVAIVLVASFALLRPLCIHLSAALGGGKIKSGDAPVAEGAGPALLMVACLVALLIWVHNPLAAVLLVLPMHLWVWVVDSDLQLPRPVALLMLLVGVIPTGLVVAYYVHAFDLGPFDLIWNGALLVIGGQIGLLAACEWCLALGCFASAVVIALSSRSHQREVPDAITVRGPASYAGPGSLGGTQSALRR
jgi:hypothetical protein